MGAAFLSQAAEFALDGVLLGLDNEAYHKGPGLSHSGLKRLRKSPFHYRELERERDVPPAAPTPQMFNGTLTHCALLEPSQFDVRYVVGPDVDKRSKEWREFTKQVPTCEVITSLQRDAAFRQADALRRLPDVAALLSSGEPEVSAYWIDEATHVLCKCRPDWVSSGWGDSGRAVMLLDVKTASDASPEGFSKAVANFGYHTQADWYCTGYALATGLEVLGMLFAVVESEYPHACAAYMVDDDALLRARMDNRKALELYARCAANDEWPGYPTGIQVITLPRWA
jgi:hypothetical protein